MAPRRRAWPAGRILIRGDSGSCREPILRRCEGDGVDYLFGLAQDARLVQAIADELQPAKGRDEETSQATQIFTDFRDQTLESWSRERRVGAEAEHREKGPDPRFVVTSLSAEERPAKPLYEEDYCGRGEREDRIKGQQLHRFADRTRAHPRRANQLRLSFSSLASVSLEAWRRPGLSGTELARAQGRTIRVKLLKSGAWGRVTVRKVGVRLASSCPYAAVLRPGPANRSRLRPVPLRC